MINLNKKTKWTFWRKVDFYPFDTYLVNEGYVRGKSQAARWRFKNVFFYCVPGYEYSFRRTADLIKLQHFLHNNLNKKFVEQVGKEIRNAARKLYKVTKKTFLNKDSLKVNFKAFVQDYINLFASFQLPELAQNLVPFKPQKLLYKFGLDREYAAKVFAKLQKIYRQDLGKLLKLPVERALYLLPEEVVKVLVKGRLPANFKKRKTCIILTENRITKVFWNKPADRFFFNQYLRYQHQLKKIRQLDGQKAYGGVATGRVYVALRESDYKKIPKNAVLVCSMTRYTIAPYLKRVAALVTDEGGITCHAAIIARELKVPTLVGTRRATEIFKTGDLVEVDAQRGVIRKLK